MLPFRILGDLLMWEPAAPAPVELSSTSRINNPFENVHINLASHIGQLDGGGGNGFGSDRAKGGLGGDRFFMCKSAVKGDGMLVTFFVNFIT